MLIPHTRAGTVLARLAVFPVIVKGQREAAKLNNVLPDMTKLTTRMNEAKQSGNKFECKNSAVFLRCICLFSNNLDNVSYVITTINLSRAAVSCYSCQSLL